jgi:Zn-dependent protease/CBS domain-containing protein
MGGKGSLTIGRVWGIPVRLHFSFLIVLPYLAWVIAQTTPVLAGMAGIDPGTLVLPRLGLGALLAVALFACVLVHEFSHVFVGRLGGGRFSGVTLMLVGGVSEVVELPRKPMHEAAMAIAGPVASLLLAVVGYLGHLIAGPADLRFGLFYLAYVNLALALFNLLPAFPMDGGRIVRALLSKVTTRVRATRVASVLGQLMAVLFLIGGLLSFNWVLLLIGLLVVGGARAELEMVKSSAALDGLRVEQGMQRFAPTVDAGDGVAMVLERMRREVRTTYFVLSRGDLVGAVTAAELKRHDGAGAAFARISDVMQRDVPRLEPDQELGQAAQMLRASRLTMLPVVQAQDLVGFVSLGTIARAVRERDEAQARGRALREQEAT